MVGSDVGEESSLPLGDVVDGDLSEKTVNSSAVGEETSTLAIGFQCIDH